MARTACVDVAALPLQLLLRDRPDWKGHPVAVVDRDRSRGTILWVNGRAQAIGILPGMRHGAALALTSSLRAGVVARETVEEAVAEVLERLLRFSPRVEPSRDEPGVFWLDTSGLSRLHPCPRQWAGLIHDELAGSGLDNTVAVGFSRFGSYAAARAGERVVLFRTPGEEHAHVRRVPLGRLGLGPEVRDLLVRLDVRSLGAFLDLPASEVRSRLGRQAHRLHRMASGELRIPLRASPPPEPVSEEILLDAPECDRHRLAALTEGLLERLLDSLGRRGEAMAALVLSLGLEDGSRWSETLRPAEPTLDKGHVLDLLGLRLEAQALSAGVTEVAAEVLPARPGARQRELFQATTPRDHEAAGRALAQLRARLGDGVLLRARLRDGHLPEARFTWEPMGALPPPKPGGVRLRPLVRRFFPEPVPFPLDRPRPDGTARPGGSPSVRESLGPYVVSGGWQGGVAREERAYHFVRTGEGPWLWIYHDRRRRGWFLHGKVE